MESPGHYQLGSPRILCSLWLFQPDEVVLHEPNIYIETENKRKLKYELTNEDMRKRKQTSKRSEVQTKD